MKTLEQPPDRLAETITSAVVDFSKDNPGTEVDLWHQNEPVWYVHATDESNGISIVRYVQVAFFRDPGSMSGGQLAAIAGAQLLNEKRGYGLHLQKSPKQILRRVNSDESPGFDDIRDMIDDAWEALGRPSEADFDWSNVIQLT
jgi:hypothetical protein